MGRKLTSLMNQHKGDYRPIPKVRTILKEEGQEDIIVYNPTSDKVQEYMQELMKIEKSEKDVNKRNFLNYIVSMKVFTDIEVDAETYDEYVQLLMYIPQDSADIYQKLHDELENIVKEVYKQIDTFSKMADIVKKEKDKENSKNKNNASNVTFDDANEYKKIENMSPEELIKYLDELKKLK